MTENRLACIDPRMTVLEIVSRHRAAEAVFKAWDSRAGECICCQALFDPVQQVADRFGLNLDQLMAELNAAINPTLLTGRNTMNENNPSPKPIRLTETVKGAG
jgi:hypothetical protein